VAKLLTIPLVTIVLAGALAFYRLPPGWLTPSLQLALTETIGNVELSLPKAKMRWGGWRHPLGIRVHNVSIKNEERNLKLEIPRLLFSLKILPLFNGNAEIGRIFFDSAKISSQNDLIGIISGKVKMRGQDVAMQKEFHSVNISALAHFLWGQHLTQQTSFMVQGKFFMEGSRFLGISKASLQCISEGGTLLIPEIYPDPLHVDQTQLTLIVTEQNVYLKKLSLKRGDSYLSLKGSLRSPITWKKLHKEGGLLEVSLEGKGGAIPVDDLKLLWPRGLSPKPRHWVVHQLSKGKADTVMTKMQGIVHVDAGAKINRFEVPNIYGQIGASQVTVHYFGLLPPATDVTGNCTFTREQFKIQAVGMANDIRLKSANIVINDLHINDQTIDIKLDLEGSIRNSLEIINSDPLYLAKKLDLDPQRFEGRAATQVSLSFPLETNVPLECVKVTAKSQIQDGKIQYDALINGKPVTLDKGNFVLDVDKETLTMKGGASIQMIPTQIGWQEHFEGKNIPFRRQFTVRGDLDVQQLKNLGIYASDYLGGKASANIHYTVGEDARSRIEGFVDLTQTVMVSPILAWQKPAGEAAHLKLKFYKKQVLETYHLDEALLVAPQLNLTVKERNKTGKVYEVDHLQIGNSHLKSIIHQDSDGVLQASIQGKVLDLSYILDDSTQEPLLQPLPSPKGAQATRFKVKLLLDEVFLGKINPIHHVDGEMIYEGNTLMKADVKGKVPHKEEKISLSMSPVSPEQQQFTLESANGGYLLEMLGADYDVEGGHLVIKGIKTEKNRNIADALSKSDKNSWEIRGNISIGNFTINKAPLLARLLSAASLKGIVNFFSGRGIHFQEGTTDFSLSPEKLVVKKMRLISPSIGLILNGSLDRYANKVNFSGELIPLYIINTILARIPLVGSWISGGREDGVFMTQFTMTGDRQDPALAINPITSLTPGLVREFLNAQESKSKV